MRTEKLLHLIGDIPDAYIVEAAPKEKSRQKTVWLKWCASAAACLAVVLAAIYTLPTFYHNINSPPASATENAGSQQQGENVSVHLNELNGVPSGGAAMFCLHWDDFKAMTADELLRYYGVTLPIEDALPSLTLESQSESSGIYQNADRGIYYDTNSFLFETGDSASKFLRITLAKAFKFPSGAHDEFVSNQALAFTKLKGRNIAIFHYTDEEGSGCYYAEFVQDDVAYYVTATNLSQVDFIKGLSALLEQDTSGNTGDTHTLTGTVNAIDPYTNLIGVTMDSGQVYEYLTVYLPKGETTTKYALNEKVSITYTGEPITVGCIWQQQLVSVEAINN